MQRELNIVVLLIQQVHVARLSRKGNERSRKRKGDKQRDFD
jgi:hypothetical protein